MAIIVNAIPRQLDPNKKAGLPYEGWSGGGSNPSGGSPGAYYGGDDFFLLMNKFYAYFFM